jgi:murein DD-endopeptidase MepM/ murein hydrolase activator NlpD
MWQPGSPESRGIGPGGVVPGIAFPVLGPVAYGDGWALARGNHGERPHEGTDIVGVSGQPLRAAFDGVVTRYQIESRGIAGVAITITRADGLRANYFHLNDDTPGTNDGAAPTALRIPAAIRPGAHVLAGQVIGFMGESGNAGIPHLHFELRDPNGTPINPYPALIAAERQDRCVETFGPWANVGPRSTAPVQTVATIDGWNDSHWLLSATGEVVAVGDSAAAIGGVGAC